MYIESGSVGCIKKFVFNGSIALSLDWVGLVNRSLLRLSLLFVIACGFVRVHVVDCN